MDPVPLDADGQEAAARTSRCEDKPLRGQAAASEPGAHPQQYKSKYNQHFNITVVWETSMSDTAMPFRVTSLAPQFLVDDLDRSITYYRDTLGFTFGDSWGGFYAIGQINGLELHLKASPKNVSERVFRRDNEHLDASLGVDGVEAYYERCVAHGARIIKPLAPTEWGTKDFYVEDPDGYILGIGGK
jgi:catechol 2,3-dioxygenase-like lactoylglutathione lyase family enzyme